MTAGKITLETLAADGRSLSVTVFQSPSRVSKRQTILISGASGVPQRFYSRFSSFLANEGFDVVTFDFRTVGLSTAPNIRLDHTTFLDWGSLDIPAMIRFCTRQWPEQRIKIIGHSGGAWLLAINPLWENVSGVYAVVAGSVYWKLMSSPERYRLFILWRFLVPVVTSLLGHAPAWLGLGVDLSRVHARQWATWSLDPQGAFGDPKFRSLFSNPAIPLTVVSIYDDKWETRAAVKDLFVRFTNAKINYREISHADAGARPIGHFGFFKESSKVSLWSSVLEWIDQTRDV